MTTEEKTHLDDHGYLVLENVLSDGEADALRDLAEALAKKERDEKGEEALYLGGRSQRVWNLVNKGEVFEAAIQNDRILEFHEYLLGADFILSSFTANLIGAGSPASGLHIDHPMSAMPTPLPSWTFCSNSVYLLTDFSPENGGTEVIPGSHTWDHGPDGSDRRGEIRQVEAKKGSVVIVNGHIWHGSGANRTDGTRAALLGFFCRPWMRPQQDHAALVSEEVWDRASPGLRALMGEKAAPRMLY